MLFSKPQVSFSSKFCILLCTFLDQTLHTFHRKDKSKCKFLRLFECSNQNSPNSYQFWKKQISFSSNVASNFSIMKHNSSVLFQLKFYILSTKGAKTYSFKHDMNREHWTVVQSLNKPWPCSFKNGMRNWVNFH